MIKDKMGRSIYGTNTMMQKAVKSNLQAGDKLEFRVCFEMNIGVGGYSISTALVDGNTHLDKNYEWVDLALIFNVANSNESDFTGCCYLKPNIKVSKE
jgi:lipopolysaccharide transport system ATP-binding protein